MFKLIARILEHFEAFKNI